MGGITHVRVWLGWRDCIEFKSKYPNFTVREPHHVGDGHCDSNFTDEYYAEGCGWDGGDCDEFHSN